VPLSALESDDWKAFEAGRRPGVAVGTPVVEVVRLALVLLENLGLDKEVAVTGSRLRCS
jgi:hypothetical protein